MTAVWRSAQRSSLKTRSERELYETPAAATHALIATGELEPFRGGILWECCAGRGRISRVLEAGGFSILASDLIDYDGADPGILTPVDFMLEHKAPAGVSVIVSNFPYAQSDRFVRHALFSLGLPTIILQPWQRAEGKRRRDLIVNHLHHIWLFSDRLPTLHRAGWTGPKTKRTGCPFGWFCFEPAPKANPSFTVTPIEWS